MAHTLARRSCKPRTFLALVLAALALAGCGANDHDVTEEDLARWQAAAEQTLAQATEIDIDADDVGCHPASCWSVDVTVTFDDYATLLQHEDELAALYALILADTEPPNVPVNVRAQALDIEDVEGEIADAVGSALGGDVPTVLVLLGSTSTSASGISTGAVLRLLVANPDAITPQLLEQATDAATEILDGYEASVESVTFHTLDAQDLQRVDDRWLDATLDVGNFAAFASVASGDCVVQGDWAFDVSQPWIEVWAIDSPQGACRT